LSEPYLSFFTASHTHRHTYVFTTQIWPV
jgi:hypothetical protein